MTIAEALRDAARALEGSSDTARLDAELLMAHALGVSRSDLLLRHMRDDCPVTFAAMVERRMRHEPVAHIIGRQEFYGREFIVTADTLIPRADSETTLQAALDALPHGGRVLDCGVGSGALLLSFLAERPEAHGIGIDRSQAALHVAAANADRLGLSDRCEMLLRDWNQAGWQDGLGKFDLVIANPPYVEDDADLAPSVREYEPGGALFAGKEGLDDYRALVPQLTLLLIPGGVAVLEIGWKQAAQVGEMAVSCGFTVTQYNDLAGRPRALCLRLGLGN